MFTFSKWWCEWKILGSPPFRYVILIFPLHFSVLSFHWPPQSLNLTSNINPQLSISTDWWLKYAEYHSLLFIDFKLKGVMGHGLRACTYSHMLDRLMIYSKSRKWVLYRCLLGSAYRSVWLHIAYLSVWTHIIRNTLKNRPSGHTVAPYRCLCYVMGLFHLAQRERPSGTTSNSYRPTLLLPSGLYFNLLQMSKSTKS